MRYPAALLLGAVLSAQTYDLVIRNGRLIDPASSTDAVRNIGIAGGSIRAVSTKPLAGRETIDATGLVVAPGFIDLHQHGQTPENYRFKAMDGVTTALELEIGTADVAKWYADRDGKALIHYGVSIGHPPTRMALFDDPGDFLPAGDAANRAATDEQISEMRRRIERGLQQGAVAVGFGVAYTPAASAWEILEMFRVAARFHAPAHIHLRRGIEGLEEAIAAAAITGAPLHVVHVNSSASRSIRQFLQIIEEARGRGLDVTTECYPYTAGATRIESALFADGWQQRSSISYKDLLWTATGERLTAESFARYRKQGGRVIMFSNTEENVRIAVAHPLTMIASDGGITNGTGHPRGAGCYARILGRYVRDEKVLDLATAIRKMTILPAQRLEQRVPAMRQKGRIAAGADADIVVFDPARVTDRSTYEKPAVSSEGFRHVLVGGVRVVRDGNLADGVLPGKAVRAPIQ